MFPRGMRNIFCLQSTLQCVFVDVLQVILTMFFVPKPMMTHILFSLAFVVVYLVIEIMCFVLKITIYSVLSVGASVL